MRLTIKRRTTDRESRWSFPSISSLLRPKSKQNHDNSKEDILGRMQPPGSPEWLTVSYSEEPWVLNDNNISIPHTHSTPSIAPLYRGRSQLNREPYSMPIVRRDTRRYAVYLPDYNFRALPLGYCGRLDPAMGPPMTIACPPPLRDRQARSRRPRQVTHRPAHVHDPDPPPQYSAIDPHPFRRGRKVSLTIAKGVEDVGKIAKDIPNSVRKAQEKVRVRRAKGKIEWLERHNYLSAQERLLRDNLGG